MPWCLLLAAALTVRVVYLAESSANPTFQAPIIDAARFDHLARSLIGGDLKAEELFWQPIFYPLWLAGTFLAVGHSFLAVKILQIVLGLATCVLTVLLGRRLVGRTAGWVAGWVVGLYGPLIAFEQELLATGWAAFWSVMLVLLMLKIAQHPTRLLALGLGLAAGAAMATRPVFGPFLVAGLVWIGLSWHRTGRGTRGIAGWSALILLGAGVWLLPLSLGAGFSTGRYTPLPLSGSLNLHLGNNPDYCNTVGLRPGADWDRLVEQAGRGRRVGLAGIEDHFRSRFVDYVAHSPGGFLAGLASKALRMVSARELPRNLDVYVLSRWSWTLKLLTWRLGRFGFPFGLLLPLVALGLWARWGQWPGVVKAFLVCMPAVVILVFVSGRYRLPMVPILAVVAAAGAQALVGLVRSGRLGARLVGAGLVFGSLLASVAPGPFCEEGSATASEMYLGAGAYHLGRGRTEMAIGMLSRALELDEDSFEAAFDLGLARMRLAEFEPAIEAFGVAHRLRPGDAEVSGWLGFALLAAGKPGDAIGHLRAHLEAAPGDVKARLGLARALMAGGECRGAEAQYREVLRRTGPDPSVLNDLAWLLSGQVCQDLKRPAEAVGLAERAAGAVGRDPSRRATTLDTLAVALAANGEHRRAAQVATLALAAAEEAGDEKLAGQLRDRRDAFAAEAAAEERDGEGQGNP